METSWKPSQGNLKNEWIEIGFGGERTINKVIIRAIEEKPFSFRVQYLNNNQWIEGGKWDGAGKEMAVSMSSVAATAIRIVLDSGEVDKVLIPEVEIFDKQKPEYCISR